MDNTNTPKYCSFCGKPIDDTALLAVGMNGAICPDCVAIANILQNLKIILMKLFYQKYLNHER